MIPVGGDYKIGKKRYKINFLQFSAKSQFYFDAF